MSKTGRRTPRTQPFLISTYFYFDFGGTHSEIIVFLVLLYVFFVAKTNRLGSANLTPEMPS